MYFGPFPSRATAERFASDFLDLFKIRRCVEEIRPDPAHPGCVYGEMSMCLRPCQAVATRETYLEEVERVREFLATEGRSLVRIVEAERERASTELNFEEAARLHKRLEKVHAVLAAPELAGRNGLATDLDRLQGVVIQPSATPQAVELFPVFRGCLLRPITFSLAPDAETGQPVSLDARLREVLAGLNLKPSGRRSEHLALLSRWFYRGTRRGEMVGFDSYEKPPFRRLVNAIGRVARKPVVY
jgi:excinuclease UvrABC nuclease subunit